MNNDKIIKILLVDDHAIVREGYRSLLEKQVCIEIIAEAGTGEQAYILYKELLPNLVIMDLSLPGQGGLVTIAKICKFDKSAKILVFSMHQNPAIALKSTQAGARAYITKSSQPDILLSAIHDVHNGLIVLSPDITKNLALEQLGHEHAALERLTVREFEILRMIVAANTTKSIAQTLNISPKTVANCHYIIKKKLAVKTDIELIHLANKLNVLTNNDQ